MYVLGRVPDTDLDRSNSMQAEPYCILRLDGQHYRTEVFSLTLDCRRTAVDDRQGI